MYVYKEPEVTEVTAEIYTTEHVHVYTHVHVHDMVLHVHATIYVSYNLNDHGRFFLGGLRGAFRPP